jgi:hypothetical protein
MSRRSGTRPSATPSPSAATWRTDTRRGLTGILLTQRMVMSPEPTQVVRDFWAAAYDAIDA